MSTHRREPPRNKLFMATGLAISALVCHVAVAGGEDPRYGIGRSATQLDVQPWNIDIAPSGEGLPPGRGTVPKGAQVYAHKCASCHGPTGVEGPADRLIGGQGTLRSQDPIKTVGSYWPYATTLYDYIYRAMPFTAPQSLTPDEVYALVAWILARNGIVKDDAVMDAAALPKVRMPNHAGFIPDPRPDTP
jgi:S-disulfanyl-L-cysteine oxidoreductase SoxD